ncbi:MAG: diaminopimelate epimerase [Chlorobi bacterium]|nr:diaminopimelate epimerase [Chlorobiota bacterium]
MGLNFYKYHGNGNDFVMIDNAENRLSMSADRIAAICHRRFGVGADGLILINSCDSADFGMVYYNSDGNEGSMCGNGGRCAAAFAFANGIAERKMEFLAYDGLHKAIITKGSVSDDVFDVSLQMADVRDVEVNKHYLYLNTGSPHYVEFVDHLAEFDVVGMGRKTRYSEKFHPAGTNVNFAELRDSGVFVRTYERGVEDETLSCGTGVTATAIAAFLKTGIKNIDVHTTGGDFRVDIEKKGEVFTDIVLHAPVKIVFKGTLI